ncbi:MAG: peptidase S41 [Ponticaulis sp.]|nr:peptidase S41 [Ponticaulis sp.]
MHKTLLSAFAGSLIASTCLTATAQTQGYYLDPAISSDAVIFASEGDLWRAGRTGGTAVRLTTHQELESNPSISPNGQWVAFEASYDGPGEIYLMPATGGSPKRVTFEGGGVSVRGWLDDTHILYRSTNLPGTIPMVLRKLNVETGATEDIPLANVDEATLSADGQTLFFTRYGLSLFSDNAVLYRGGRMAQLWSYTLGSDEEATRLAADFGAPIRHPMVWQGRIYFVTDKSGVDNIWSMTETGTDIRQETSSEAGLIKTPYLHGGVIAWQSGADLFTYDLATSATSKLDLFLMSDGDYERDRWVSEPLNYLEAVSIAPSGKSATITARGKFVTAFTKDRRRVEYRVPDGYRARSASLGFEDKWVYVIMDGGQRGEIWRFPADGVGEGEAITSASDTYIWNIYPSPHDASLLYSDKRGRLFFMSGPDATPVEVDKTPSSNDNGFDDLSWSADGRYISYTSYDNRDLAQITVLDTETRETYAMTSGKYQSYSPTFSADGKWLYFLSDRHFNASPGSPWGDRNMGPAFNDRSKIYALQLDEEADFPFRAKTELDLSADEKDESEEEETDESEDDGDEEEKPAETHIDFAGLSARLWEVPLPSGDYRQLAATEQHLLVLSDEGENNTIKRVKFDPDDIELSTFVTRANGFSLSADLKTALVMRGRGSGAEFLLVHPDKSFPSDASSSRVRLSDWSLRLNPKSEWEQMANDAWRLHRDFAFDPGLRDVDWDAVGATYLPLANRIGHRAELNDLLAQMSAQLGILHSQIRQGDQPDDDESGRAAFLGATYSVVSGGLRVDTIYNGEADLPNTLGPLRSPDVDIQVGDVIQSVNGQSVGSLADLSDALMMTAGDQILVEYSRSGTKLKEIVVPVSRGRVSGLRYADWVEGNRKAVAERTDGEFGYLHLRAMGSGDLESFVRDFYEHFDKDGLIIDVRGNRGGNVDSVIIATLLRRAWAFWGGLEGGPVYTNMQQTFRGHLVVLIDEGTYSDGETFSAGVKALDLAPLIGTRTAGAGIWLSDRNRLSDRGQARVAEYAQYGLDGRWLVEGYGVAPDIEVENLPHESYLGKDAQLEAAIAYLRDKLASDPIPDLVPGPIPPVGEPGRDVK